MPEALRSIDALVKAASASATPEEAADLLAVAAQQAAASSAWKQILEAMPAALPARRAALADQALRSARQQRDVWCFDEVATFQAAALGLPERARETLREAEQVLETLHAEGQAQGVMWGVLARSWAEVTGDDADARRLLEAGWAATWAQRDVENLGRLANVWSQLLGQPEAVARLGELEAAARTWGHLDGVIYWWHALGDAAAGNRVRAEVLAQATTCDAVLELVRFWNLYEPESPGRDAALARAEALAQTVDEWFALAEVARFEASDDALARRALDRAAALASGPERKAQVTQSYVEWFDDDAASRAVGPRGLPPEQLRPRVTRMEGWPASASALLDLLRARIRPEQLTAIASADYGDAVDKHRAALQEICESGRVPAQLAWHPGEVVELTRWSEGPETDHLARALCCTLLCLASRDDDLTSTGPALIESVLLLGGDEAARAEQLLAWHLETLDPGESALAIDHFLLGLLAAARAPADPRLVPLFEALATDPAAADLREQLAQSQRAELWTELVDRYLLPLHRRPELTTLLDALGFPA